MYISLYHDKTIALIHDSSASVASDRSCGGMRSISRSILAPYASRLSNVACVE